MLDFAIVLVIMGVGRESFGHHRQLQLPGLLAQVHEEAIQGEEKGIKLCVSVLTESHARLLKHVLWFHVWYNQSSTLKPSCMRRVILFLHVANSCQEEKQNSLRSS